MKNKSELFTNKIFEDTFVSFECIQTIIARDKSRYKFFGPRSSNRYNKKNKVLHILARQIWISYGYSNS